MDSKKQLVADMEILASILIDLCKQAEQSEDVQKISFLVNYMYRKIEKLYLLTYN